MREHAIDAAATVTVIIIALIIPYALLAVAGYGAYKLQAVIRPLIGV